MISARTLEVLREERARHVKVIERIDDVLKIVGGSTGLDERPRHDVPTGHGSGRRQQYDWQRGRVMYEEEDAPVPAIADALGCSKSAVKGAKLRDGWVRKEPNVNDAAVVFCPSCERQTSADPCEHCHISLPTAVNQALFKLQTAGKPKMKAVANGG